MPDIITQLRSKPDQLSHDAADEILKLRQAVAKKQRTEASHAHQFAEMHTCLLYTSPSPRDRTRSRMPSSA